MNIDLNLNDVARRDGLADQICTLLRSDPHVTDIAYYGSLATAQADLYSDIDIKVQLKDVSDREFAEALPELIRPAGSMLLESWSLGALPDLYARSFYLTEYPLFWHVDIACHSDTHIDGSDLKQMYHWSQIFKIWVDEVSNLLRGRDTLAFLEKIMQRWADLTPMQDLTPAAKLSRYLGLCVERARSRNAPCETFYQRCDALRQACLK